MPSGRGGGGGAPFLPRLLGAAANGFGRAWTASATLPQTVFQSMTCRACNNVSPNQCDARRIPSFSHPRCTHTSPAHHWSPADGPGRPVPPRLLPLRRVRPGTRKLCLFFFLRNLTTHRPLPVNASAVQRALLLPPGRPPRALSPSVRPLLLRLPHHRHLIHPNCNKKSGARRSCSPSAAACATRCCGGSTSPTCSSRYCTPTRLCT